ncbi:toll/interleukin-1 receptor domain-containing protein [Sphaerisporangium dianthi]|uniref:Toll/interleukin-1 receptor domain-containing protein n=1 Tax=Sphaerisporangium dianthi TaxID=1436120 RepID=A0ABV9CFU7_9ACTN
MDLAGLALTLVGTVAGIAGAYFAWVPIRGQLSRRRARRQGLGAAATAASHTTTASSTSASSPTSASPAASVNTTSATVYDVFVSYSHDDAKLVKDLVERLRHRGIRVALDEVFMRPGTPLVHGIEKTIRESAHGLLVFSHASMASGWVTNEYYILIQRSIETGQLFIPVRTDDVPLPEFARTRFYSDLCDVGDDVFDERMDQLAEALRAAS